MQTLNVYTIRELMLTPAIKCNQTILAKLLDINRGTLRKYMDDTSNDRHSVFLFDAKYVFMHSTSPHPNRRT